MQLRDRSTSPLASWTGNEVCSSGRSATQWEGITCLGGRVAAVNLTGLGVSGPLDAIGQLTGLSSLSLWNNSFTGTPYMVAAQFVEHLAMPLIETYSLSILTVSEFARGDNSGTLPICAWRGLSNLTVLQLGLNQFVGTSHHSL